MLGSAKILFWQFAEMKYSENMLAIPLWIRKYIYDYTSTVDTDNGEMDLLAYRNILYIEDNFTKGDLAIWKKHSQKKWYMQL